MAKLIVPCIYFRVQVSDTQLLCVLLKFYYLLLLIAALF